MLSNGQRQAIELSFNKIGFKPTEGQEPILFDDHKRLEVVGGVRSGKSKLAAMWLFSRFLLGKLYWLIAIDYEQCREEFGFLEDAFRKLGIITHCSFPNRDQCVLELAGGIRIETKSAKYKEKIAGKPLDGILLCEAAQMPYDIFTRSLERLIQNDGWLMMTGTLETSLDWYADKYKDYQMPGNLHNAISFSLPSWSNTGYEGCPFEGGRNDPKILEAEAICGPDLFMERYGGVPIKPKGLVFPEFKATWHTGNYPFDPKEPVFITIDPGWSPSAYAVEFVQFIGDEIFVVDEIYEQFMMDAQIITMAMQRPCYKNVSGGAIDIGAKQHHGGKPIYEIWRDMTGLKLDTRKIQPIDDGVNTLRTFLLDPLMHGNPRLHIDSKCRGLISEFGGCKSPLPVEITGIPRGAWKLKTDKTGNVLGGFEDRNCDALKALIYGIVSEKGFTVKRRKASVSYIEGL